MSGRQEKDHGRNPLMMTVSTMHAYNVHAFISAKCIVSSWSVMLINARLTEVVICCHECVLSRDQSLCDASSHEMHSHVCWYFLHHVTIASCMCINFTDLEPADKDMQEFWQHLPKATWSDDGKILQLAAGTSFLGMPKYGDKLMQRACYADFQNMLQQHHESGGEGFAVIGNSGMLKQFLLPLCGCSYVVSPHRQSQNTDFRVHSCVIALQALVKACSGFCCCISGPVQVNV
jgi:hypothetical protein